MAKINENLIRKITTSQIKKDLPHFSTGDTIKVHIKIKEGNKERIQIFEGIVIKKQGAGISKSFTVRKISLGVGVEKTFPLHAVSIAKIEVSKKGKVRQSKIFYLRKLRGKAAKIKTIL